MRSVGWASACSELAQHIEQLICSVSGVVPLSHDIRDVPSGVQLSGGCASNTWRLIHGVYVNMSPRMVVMVSGKVSSGLL